MGINSPSPAIYTELPRNIMQTETKNSIFVILSGIIFFGLVVFCMAGCEEEGFNPYEDIPGKSDIDVCIDLCHVLPEV